MSWGNAALALGSAAIGWLSNRSANKQSEKNQREQLRGQKELNQQGHQLSLDTWNKTNYPAQVEQMKKAGLNPALMYGMGAGGGGQLGSGGGGAAGQAQAHKMETPELAQLGLMNAQKGLIEAQTAKTEAEAAKTQGVDTKESEGRITAQEFQNKVNDTIGAEAIAKNYAWAAEKTEIESQRANAEWETYLAVGYEGKSFRDEKSPIAKAMKAGFDKTVEELKQAKIDTNIKGAEATIERFKADLTKQGLSPETPWYYKILGDLLDKAGLNPSKLIGDAAGHAAKSYLNK